MNLDNTKEFKVKVTNVSELFWFDNFPNFVETEQFVTKSKKYIPYEEYNYFFNITDLGVHWTNLRHWCINNCCEDVVYINPKWWDNNTFETLSTKKYLAFMGEADALAFKLTWDN